MVGLTKFCRGSSASSSSVLSVIGCSSPVSSGSVGGSSVSSSRRSAAASSSVESGALSSPVPVATRTTRACMAATPTVGRAAGKAMQLTPAGRPFWVPRAASQRCGAWEERPTAARATRRQAEVHIGRQASKRGRRATNCRGPTETSCLPQRESAGAEKEKKERSPTARHPEARGTSGQREEATNHREPRRDRRREARDGPARRCQCRSFGKAAIVFQNVSQEDGGL